MLTGAAEVGGPDPDRAKVMVVLTDGKENVAPFIAEAVADLQANSSHIQTYSVGLGFDIEPTKLQSITNMGTEGYHQVVSTLRDETLFDLETFYFKIFSSAADLDLVTDPTHIINLASGNPVVVDHARVISSDRSATFLILDDPMMRTLYDLEFIAPDGTVLQAGSTVGGIPIHEQTRNTYRIFRIIFPDPAQDDTYVGDWLLRLVPRGNWTEVLARNLAAEFRMGYGGFMHPADGEVPIGFAGAVASDYHLEASVTATSFLPGATLGFEAALTDRGWPAPDGTVTVTVTRPDGTVHAVDLFDDGAHGDGGAGDAVWAAIYVQTAPQGVYKLLFRSTGHNERGELAPRLVSRYVTLAQLEPDPGEPDGDGDGTRCPNCEGNVSAYLIGSYDMRPAITNLVQVMNPTAQGLEFVVALFTEDGDPVRCERDRIPPNGIRQIDIDRLDPPNGIGVVKVVAVPARKSHARPSASSGTRPGSRSAASPRPACTRSRGRSCATTFRGSSRPASSRSAAGGNAPRTRGASTDQTRGARARPDAGPGADERLAARRDVPSVSRSSCWSYAPPMASKRTKPPRCRSRFRSTNDLPWSRPKIAGLSLRGRRAGNRFRSIATLAGRKLDMLDAAQSLSDLRSPPGNRLEALRGRRAGQHSIRINDQWRICFVWTDGAEDVEIVDYH